MKHGKPILEASYKVACAIARQKVPYTSGKTDQTCCTENVASRPSGRSRISLLHKSKDISDYVHAQIITSLNSNATKLSLQLDETTDVGNMSQLLGFVC